ncbi:hypothetical protein Tco_1291648 [Tanacetum coccineum]
MESFLKCRALRDAVGGWDWVAMMVLYCRSSAAEDRDFARLPEKYYRLSQRRMNELLQEMVATYDNKVDFIRELEVVPGVDAVAKTVEFLNENLWKDDKKLRKLHNMEIDASMRADQKERFIEKLYEDLILAREINALCAHLTAIVDERETFADELDILAGRSVPGKMAEFMKQVQGKDIPNLMKLKILGREFELRAREGRHGLLSVLCWCDETAFFQLSLSFFGSVEDGVKRGLFVGFSFVVPPASFILIDCATVVRLVGGVRFSLFLLLLALGLPLVAQLQQELFKGWLFTMHVILELQIPLLQELSRAADSYDITHQLSMLFRREVVEDSQRMHDYRRLCDELIECVRMRDEYMNELRMLDNSEEIIEY